jgi:transcriptional regulator with GAF, ATPase, and Fis domain
MFATRKLIQPEDLRLENSLHSNPLHSLPDPHEGFQMNDFLDELKLHLIGRSMELSGGVQARAARILGITPQAINQFLKSRESSR